MFRVVLHETALKSLQKLDRPTNETILRYLHQRLDTCSNPRTLGKPLVGKKAGLWRYRVGNYRLICQIKDKELIILVITIDHRKSVYRT